MGMAAYVLVPALGQVVSTAIGHNSEFRMPTPVLFTCIHLAVNALAVYAYDLVRTLKSQHKEEYRIPRRELVAVLVNALAVWTDIFVIKRVEPHVLFTARALLGLTLWTRSLAVLVAPVLAHQAYDWLEAFAALLAAGLRLAWLSLLYPSLESSTVKERPLRQKVKTHLTLCLAIHTVALFFTSELDTCLVDDFFSRHFTEWTFWLETSVMALCALPNLVLMWSLVERAPLRLVYLASLVKTLVVVPALLRIFILRPLRLDADPCP